MSTFQKFFALGRLGADPERRNENLVTFSVATSFKDNTDWHNCQVWGKQAEVAEKYLRKGDSVFIEGRVSYFKNDKGITYTNINVSSLTLIGGKKSGGDGDFPF